MQAALAATSAAGGATLHSSQRRLCGSQPCVKPLGARLVGVRSPGRPSVVAGATYKVTFKLPEGEEKTFECPDDTYILDAAEDAGIELPYACRGGTCSSCACRVLEGTVDQSEQSYLDEKEMAAGFALICSSYPTSDVVLLSHQETAVADFAMDEMQAELKKK